MGAGRDPTGGQMAPMVLSQLLDGLTGLQRGTAGAAAKLGIDTDTIDAADSAVLRSLGASPLLRWLQPNDAVTIELVAMLFDCIFSDAEVPQSLRAAIGKLQVPVLKVALMNKGFFSDRRHPARRLLDVMAAAARGWGQQDEQALLARIRTAVDNVLAGFDQDTSVFDAEVAEIEGILREAERAARGQVGELVQRLEQRDRRAVADAVVSDQIERRLHEAGPVPAPVDAFVDSHWRELLGRIYVRLGDGGEDWRVALGTLEDLLWSVQPKALPEDRQRLTQLLPQLLERLPAGLARIGRAAAWEPFLADLMPLHMAAIKTPPPQARPESEAAPGESVGSADVMPPPDSEGLPWLLDSEASAPQDDAPAAPDGVAAAAMPASAAISSAVPDEAGHEPGPEPESEAAPGCADTASRDPWLEAARAVAVGDWLEVAQLGGANLSLRATWLSRQSGLMLFADRRGRNARVLSAERLATALRDGSARLLSRDPLTDRAVARLLVSAAPAEQTAA
jgi:hypothetical protein